ncbi:CocE/NonD family hydrolase [Nocardioides insulae]|uniref:CocE/NonD family hydrolase n=1 Tax=Nocardioides insulae TaxID=394734 RepID=UPI00041FB866|nr:CocE/NonD family hydrolase [Nocardioides insulae]
MLRVLGAAVALATTATLTTPSSAQGAGLDSAASSVAPDPRTTPDDPFFGYDRPATYTSVRQDLRVPVRDGSRLACQLYRPGTDEATPAPGRFPGIVYEYTAYADNAAAFGEGAGYFVERGYEALVCQARGSGESPGHLDPFSPQEQRDNYDVIEWLADRPSSTGEIGQMGLSYGAHSTLLVSVNQPPSLRATIPIMGLSDWYENTIYRGGIPNAQIRSWQEATAPETLETYPAHPTYDRFWAGRSVKSRWHKLTVPTLEINGWYDRYRDGMIGNQQARPRNVWLVSGPWTHGYPEGQHGDIGRGGYLAWWDHWLRGDDAPLPRAKVTSYETPGPGPGPGAGAGTGWQQYDQWPPSGTRRVDLALGAEGRLRRGGGKPGVATYTVNTDTSAPEDGEKLTFASAPVARDVVIAGSPEARLRARFTATEGHLATVLYDEAPDGSRTRVTEGWLKASHRNSHAEVTPVRPGRAYDLDVHIWPAHYRLKAGHRLVLRVSSDDYPEIDSTAPAGEVGISLGAGGSSLMVPVLAGRGALR